MGQRLRADLKDDALRAFDLLLSAQNIRIALQRRQDRLIEREGACSPAGKLARAARECR